MRFLAADMTTSVTDPKFWGVYECNSYQNS